MLYDEWEQARQALAVKVLAYCVMPDHVHTVLWAERGEAIKRYLQRTLGKTSRRLLPGKSLWKERPRVIPVYSAKVLNTKVDYLHRNPLRKGLAENPEDWQHSSFRQLVLGDSFVAFVCDSWDGILA